MISIQSINDLKKINSTAIKKVVTKLIYQILSDYNVDNISCFGKIVIIETSAEFDEYKKIGLAEPINNNLEFRDVIHIKKCNRDKNILLGCIVVSDDYAIDIVFDKKNVTDEQVKRFSSDIQNREYEIRIDENENHKT